jgi:hypothetical protein
MDENFGHSKVAGVSVQLSIAGTWASIWEGGGSVEPARGGGVNGCPSGKTWMAGGHHLVWRLGLHVQRLGLPASQIDKALSKKWC